MTRLRLATLNLHNLQLPHEATHPGLRPVTTADYDRKLTWLAAMVQRLDADVLALQELWSPRCLRHLFEKVGLAETHALIADGAANATGDALSVALAVRRPFTAGAHAFVRDFPAGYVLRKRPQPPPAPEYSITVDAARFSKPVLRCEVRPPLGDPIVVFVAHLKSRLPMELDAEEAAAIRPHARTVGEVLSTVRRTVEAGAVRVLVEQATLAGARPVVVMGDFNDGIGSRTLATLCGPAPWRPDESLPSSMRPEASLYPVQAFADPRGVSPEQPTHLFDGRGEAFDHVLVSAQFHPHSRRRQWGFQGLRVFNDHLFERSGDDALRVIPDHAAVAATFAWSPAN